jgi:ATP-dependent Clp protease adaptor protein ClpS
MTPTQQAPVSETTGKEQITPLYNVVLLDDQTHSYDYVIEMLARLFLMSEVDAYRHAEEVDRTGRTVVITCELPQAEFARDQIRGYGADPRIEGSVGSMSAILERAGGA